MEAANYQIRNDVIKKVRASTIVVYCIDRLKSHLDQYCGDKLINNVMSMINI